MAIDMRRRMRELQDLWRDSGIENPLQIRMGIHTGYCTVGNFGSESRMERVAGGVSLKMAVIVEIGVSPSNGRLPVAIS